MSSREESSEWAGDEEGKVSAAEREWDGEQFACPICPIKFIILLRPPFFEISTAFSFALFSFDHPPV